jgi:hypothetical protein
MDWNFDAKQHAPWAIKPEPAPVWRPDFADDDELKAVYGIEWARQPDAFKAGLTVFNDAVNFSLWASQHWTKDPIVVASRDAYAITMKKAEKPLTKEELLSKVLAFSDEKDTQGRPLVEAKERLNALKLYSEIQGFTGKIDINASTNTINNTNNTMKILLVKPESKEEPKVIKASNAKSEMSNEEPPIIALKLVGGGSR